MINQSMRSLLPYLTSKTIFSSESIGINKHITKRTHSQWCWWLKVCDDFGMLATEFRCWWHLLNVDARCSCKKIIDVSDQNGQNVTIRLQHLSPTSMKPITRSDWTRHWSFIASILYISFKWKNYKNRNDIDNELVHGKSRKSHLDPDNLVWSVSILFCLKTLKSIWSLYLAISQYLLY